MIMRGVEPFCGAGLGRPDGATDRWRRLQLHCSDAVRLCGRRELVTVADGQTPSGRTEPAVKSRESVVPFGQTEASVLLDLLRGLAAVVVLLDHWRNALFVDYEQLPHWRWMAAVPYLITSGGHQAVVVFFVLSGYLIGGTIFRAVGRGQWSWRTYLLHRLVRLWIVLLPGLALCEVWDRLGIRLGRAPLLYAGANYNHLTLPVLPRLGAAVFAGNLFFVGGLHIPTLGSDGPLWSLGFEFWYYILFPAVFLLVLERRWAARVLLAGVALLAGWIGGPGVLMMFPVWLLGVCLAAAKRLPQVAPGVRWTVVAVYVPVFFVLSKVRFLPGLISDYVLGLLTAGLMVALLSARKRAEESRSFARFSRLLARFSFTLYVAHLPFLLLLMSLAAGDARWPVTGRTVALSLLLLAFTLGYAWLLGAATEFRTATLRDWLEQRALPRPAR
jgi:peptidoglycan/LPS O-acetylase OafA/YrhL